MKKAEIYRMERENGLSYQQIADKYGVSKQAVHQVCSKYTPARFRYWTQKMCIYVNLRNWLNDNKITKSELIRRLGYETLQETYARVGRYLRGGIYPPKRTIDKFIEVTGLTYEELWVIG